MKDVKVYTPSGRTSWIHNVHDDEDWRDRYQWIWGIWPEDDCLITSVVPS